MELTNDPSLVYLPNLYIVKWNIIQDITNEKIENFLQISKNYLDVVDKENIGIVTYYIFWISIDSLSRCNDPVLHEELLNFLHRLNIEIFSYGVGFILKYNPYKLLNKYIYDAHNYKGELLNIYLDYFNKIFINNHLYNDFSLLRKLFLRDLYNEMVENLNNERVVNSDGRQYLRDVIMMSLQNSPLFTRDQRIEFDVCTEIRSFTEYRNNEEMRHVHIPCEADSYVRIYSVLLALKIADYIVYDSLLKDIVQGLQEKYDKIAGKRYFDNSQSHFIKLRILQFFNIILDKIDFKDYEYHKLSQWLLNNLTTEAHQISVKILIQWLYSRIIIKVTRNHEEIVELLLTKVRSLNGVAVSSLFPILYHVLQKNYEQKLASQVIDMLLTHSMGPNFSVRFAAQVAIKYILDHWKIEEYKNIHQIAIQIINDTSKGQNEEIFELEYLELSKYMTFDTIYYHLPRLTGVQNTEWTMETSSMLDFQQIKNLPNSVCFKNKNDFLSNLKCTNKITTADDIAMVEYTIVQKKFVNTVERKKPKSNLILVASLIDKIPNLGGLSRTCEIFGVKQLILSNALIVKHKEYQSLSMSSELWVDTKEVKIKDLPEYLTKMIKLGYLIVGAEQTSCSKNLNEYTFEKDTVLVLGNEKEGIPANLIHLLDVCLEIPQFGQLRSLNVHVAGALFIWEYMKQMSRSQ